MVAQHDRRRGRCWSSAQESARPRAAPTPSVSNRLGVTARRRAQRPVGGHGVHRELVCRPPSTPGRTAGASLRSCRATAPSASSRGRLVLPQLHQLVGRRKRQRPHQHVVGQREGCRRRAHAEGAHRHEAHREAGGRGARAQASAGRARSSRHGPRRAFHDVGDGRRSDSQARRAAAAARSRANVAVISSPYASRRRRGQQCSSRRQARIRPSAAPGRWPASCTSACSRSASARATAAEVGDAVVAPPLVVESAPAARRSPR